VVFLYLRLAHIKELLLAKQLFIVSCVCTMFHGQIVEINFSAITGVLTSVVGL